MTTDGFLARKKIAFNLNGGTAGPGAAPAASPLVEAPAVAFPLGFVASEPGRLASAFSLAATVVLSPPAAAARLACQPRKRNQPAIPKMTRAIREIARTSAGDRRGCSAGRNAAPTSAGGGGGALLARLRASLIKLMREFLLPIREPPGPPAGN